ncbi:regulation of transcription by RNA polymerase II [Dimargaris xerosporica]|nr:regulation of transcription by RNA polymerase II [Dimargaris xerosporica]
MAVTANELKQKLLTALEADHVEVTDLSSGCGQNIEVLIVSKKFEGLRLLKRHGLVNAALKDEIGQIHAFSQKTLTPAEWQQRQAAPS